MKRSPQSNDNPRRPVNGTGFASRETCPGPPVDTAASCAKPDRPNPQSQSLSRSYGSNLPTSLTYIILSTRGCSPWRPAADMGTSWRDSAVISLGFSRSHRTLVGERAMWELPTQRWAGNHGLGRCMCSSLVMAAMHVGKSLAWTAVMCGDLSSGAIFRAMLLKMQPLHLKTLHTLMMSYSW